MYFMFLFTAVTNAFNILFNAEYPVMEVNNGFNYSPAKGVRMAAIFPSDIEDDHLRQSVPLTSDEQQPAESSDTSIQMMRRVRNSAGSDTLQSSPSPHHSVHSLPGHRSAILHTFQPHLCKPGVNQCEHPTMMTCVLCDPNTTVAVVHSGLTRGGSGSCPRLDTIISEDEMGGGQTSCDDRDITFGILSDGYHGSQPPGHETGIYNNSLG